MTEVIIMFNLLALLGVLLAMILIHRWYAKKTSWGRLKTIKDPWELPWRLFIWMIRLVNISPKKPGRIERFTERKKAYNSVSRIESSLGHEWFLEISDLSNSRL